MLSKDRIFWGILVVGYREMDDWKFSELTHINNKKTFFLLIVFI